ncbi:MAG: iron-sulfur cluster insertion protein ErpA [Anderseniella sp.]|jgi:iron-sulfur cluster assembly accessory protein|nr:iron-sulfur cluster insertion protein ErpA [Anderseniella sp.]
MANAITLTEAAAKRISEIVSSEPDKSALRLAVNGGGCSGFSYEFSLDANAQDGDTVVERDGATLLIDSVSLVYVLGSQIDFVDDLMAAQFQVNNPNATASCGCGTSFSI